MPDAKSPADFPMMQGIIRTFMSDGQDIAIEVPTEEGPVHFRVEPGQIGSLVGKLFAAATEAQRRRGENKNLAAIVGDFKPVTSIANPTIP